MSGERCRAPFRLRARLAGLVFAGAAAAALIGAGLAQPIFPQLTGRIVDEAGLLAAADRAAIEAELAALEAKSTDQVAVVTVNSLQGYPIEDYGYRLGRAWGIGQKDKDNGILLIVAPNERKVRIEVGRGLEPVMTDGMSKLIIDNAILPAFRNGDFAGGIRAGVRDIKDVLLGDAEAVKERAAGRGELDAVSIFLLLFWIAVTIFVIWAIVESARTAPPGAVRQRRRGGDPVVVPGDSGSWDGGWSSGGGGGWSGGGGDFGGGGASGSW